ncbi:ankyrin repeat domain-containing protein 50-like [Haliotis rufescens]|uniref:ankyrin repeat domain-containing protein 50-like n=1 Tax=Haliotis rufescens TaxID=6454 RepID=UPI00201E840B|nr:ankyrin repeat domain-containing protein 50-like [Haliotis rufescens]
MHHHDIPFIDDDPSQTGPTENHLHQNNSSQTISTQPRTNEVPPCSENCLQIVPYVRPRTRGFTNLQYAAKEGNLQLVKKLLSEGRTDIESIGEYGRTAVMLAAEKGHRVVFDVLVNAGGDMTVVDDDGNNILHLACLGGNVDMVRGVLSRNAVDINSRGQFGRTPVMVAAEKGCKGMYNMLVSFGGNETLFDEDGNNILHVACLGGKDDMVRYIIAKNIVDVNSRGQCGSTPLMLASEKGHKGIFDLIVKRGGNVRALDDYGNNILHMACCGGNVRMVRYLISKRFIDINSKGQDGGTPLMCAAEMGHRVVFEILVRKGGNVSLLDDKGDDILHAACLGGNTDMVRYILSKYRIPVNSRGQFGRNPVMAAAQQGCKELFDYLVRKGGNVTHIDNDGNNILHVACIGGHVQMVQHVLSMGFGIDINSRGQQGKTPVWVAAQMGPRDVFDFLVGEGADISQADDDGNNILHAACLGGNIEMVRHILAGNIMDINARNKFNSTAAMLANTDGQRLIFDILVAHGCTVDLE